MLKSLHCPHALMLVLPTIEGGAVDTQTLAISIGSSVAGVFLIVLCLVVVTGKLLICMYTIKELKN